MTTLQESLLLHDPVVKGLLQDWEDRNAEQGDWLEGWRPDNSSLLFLADYMEERGKGSWGRALRWMVSKSRFPLGGENYWWWNRTEEEDLDEYSNSLPIWSLPYTKSPHHPHVVHGMIVEEGQGLQGAVWKLLLLWEKAEQADAKEYLE